VNTTADEPLKLKRAVSAADLSSAVREYTIPSRASADGISVPVSPVVIVDPSSDPHRLVPQGWWLWQASHVLTQDGGGGGALRLNVTVPTGTVMRLIACQVIGAASAGATLNGYMMDEDGLAQMDLVSIAAGASRRFSLPINTTASTTHANQGTSEGLIVGPGSYLRFDSSVALQTETMVIKIVGLLNSPNIPVITATGSGGTPNLAASTISEANTLQKVDLPW